jgi:hypothetical protein
MDKSDPVVRYYFDLFTALGFEVKDGQYVPQNGVPGKYRFYIADHGKTPPPFGGEIERIENPDHQPEIKLEIPTNAWPDIFLP